jgi:excisionase family DNA binding protein
LLSEQSGAKCNNEALLNTAEAAHFLRVSQASIRRWSDAGLLQGHRVGRRGERRFRQEDLVAFLNRGVAAAPAAATTVNLAGRTAGVPLHLLALFSTDEGGMRLTVPFLAEGVRLHQPCFLVASGELLRRYERALGSLGGVDVVDFKAGTAVEAIAQWEQGFSAAAAQGDGPMRVVGDMANELTMFANEEEMLRYEEAFEVMCRRYPVAVICQYDVRQFGGVSLLRAMKAHPDIFGFRLGAFLN